MHNRCTHSDCRADLPRHAQRCLKCGRMTGRHGQQKQAPKTLLVKPIQRRSSAISNDKREAIAMTVQHVMRMLRKKSVVLESDLFDALSQNRFILVVVAVKHANDGYGLKKVKQITDTLRMSFD